MSPNNESSLTFWFEMIDESCFVINDRRSVLSNADILIRVATSVIEYGLLLSIFILATVRYDMMAAQRWILRHCPKFCVNGNRIQL